jgi:hypothetical protein
MRFKQVCDALRVGWRRGIVGLVAQIDDNDRLILGPDMVGDPQVEALFCRKIEALISGVDLCPTGRVGRMEVFAALRIGDAVAAASALAEHWTVADRGEWRDRNGLSDLWVFEVPSVRLPGGGLLGKVRLRCYQYPTGKSKFAKVELAWRAPAGTWQPEDQVLAAFTRLWGRLAAVLRPRVVNLSKLAEQRHRWRGLGITSRVGQWQTRALRLIDVPHTVSTFKQNAARVYGECPSKPRRLLRSLADRGLLDQFNDGPDPLFGPVASP